ncbi:tetratricopeptide repeat-containing sensor histidine kinase [Mucilaginibacter rigui]|uniref:histidine kinase n=1 Tax=Mucilaginibacter rigui TaxID=534635 RepID=A0ABR7X2U6_9SPHI|nr:tetratricopeptide repeat-containing sensor histidine kinase [Mucilaginibacter rigui]MBD1384924.1 tetratricopeptide repeat-containing sensor histidine kinase [Mucilaginibacter rigui]
MINFKDQFAKYIPRHVWLYTFLIFFLACGKKNNDKEGYSEEFEKARNEIELSWSKEKVKEGLLALDTAFNKITNPTINDRFRFYGYHFVYYQKTVRQFDKALAYTDSMFAINSKSAKTKQYFYNIADASFARGDALFSLKRFSEAYQSYYQGYLVGKNYLNKEALGDYTYRMAMIMYKQGHYRLALNYFKDTYKFFEKSGDGFVFFYRRQELWDNVGLSYRHLNQPDSAIMYFDKALALINEKAYLYPDRKQHLESARGVVYGNKADIYIAKKQYTQAIQLLKKSITINLQQGYDNHDAQLAEIKLGQIYFNLEQKDSLVNLLGTLRKQLDSTKNDEVEADYNRLLGNYFVKENDLKQAIAHIQRYNILKDSLTQRTSLLMETDVNQQLANYEKQHEIDTLSNDNKLQVIYLYVTIFFAAMALIIILLVYRNWKRSKKDVQTVNILNRQINEQNHILEKALTELNSSSQEKDRILRTVAHDLRNPIGGIASLTAMMADDEYTDEQKELINLVQETSLNSLELINEILEATNLASVDLNLEPVEINSLVNNSVELLRFKAAEKGQKIILDTLDKQQDLYISREKIWRVISNLISNAIKFSPTGGTIHVKVAEVNTKIIIAVKDNGIGIPDKLKDQVFNMFTSAQRPGTSGEKSFGLGLSICRQIMEKHHGRIWFESDTNIGTTFFISLPISVYNLSTGSPQQGSIPVS